MAELEEHLGAMPPLVIAAYTLIVVAAMAVAWRLAGQWRSHRVAMGGRVREFLALALATGVGIAVVAFAHAHFQRQADLERLQAELNERARIAVELRSRINSEVDVVRAMLAERTVANIERNTLTAARADLARFAGLKDARISQMVVLIDTELELRALVAQSLHESDPRTLASVYARLHALVPDNQEYRAKAERFAADARQTP
ncbi:MAG: hypothetical protein ABIR55_03035 [Burkholderiaceae bacterium]